MITNIHLTPRAICISTVAGFMWLLREKCIHVHVDLDTCISFVLDSDVSTRLRGANILDEMMYEVTVHPSYLLTHLEAVDVSLPFVDFLRSMRMVKEYRRTGNKCVPVLYIQIHVQRPR